jgi:hypothetical protein
VTVEGLISMLVFFALLTIIVQVGFLVIARNAAAGAVQGAIREVSVDPGSLDVARERLRRDLAATVPGATDAVVSMTADASRVTGVVEFEWTPPGPDLLPVRIAVSRDMPVVVPP